MGKQAFQTEVRQLLDIVIHAFYSDREIFVRELISNASDALEKLRLKQLTGAAVLNPERELRLSISTNEEGRTLTIADAGIGMTRDEVVEFLGTIAHSGTKKFLEAMKATQGNVQNLIGQFGVGFYSVFMVAAQVEVTTRSWEPEASPVRWTSDGQDGYTLDEAPADTPRGTSIFIRLKEDAAEFCRPDRLRYIVEKYSNFIGFPIDFNGEHLNTVRAIWLKSKNEVTQEEYEAFYKFTAHTDTAPLTQMHFSAEAPIMLHALLFVPQENPEGMGFGHCEPEVALYCHKVLIDSKPKNLLPEWLRFLTGVVDSEDLPLNISREMLQDNSLLRRIASTITKRFIKHLEDLAKDSPDTYERFWTQFNRFIKEGIVTSWEHKESLAKLLRFESTFTEPGKLTSFADYVSRMKENQKEIYVLFGNSRSRLESSPYLDPLKAHGLEVILLTDGGDQFVMDSLIRVNDKPLRNIARADLDLPPSEDANVKPDSPGLSEDEAKTLTAWLESEFKDKLSKVSTGERVVTAPAIALLAEGDLTPDVKSYLKAMGQTVPESHPQVQLNPHHPLVQKLAELHKTDASLAKLLADQIVDSALLRAGLLDDPTKLPGITEELLARVL